MFPNRDDAVFECLRSGNLAESAQLERLFVQAKTTAVSFAETIVAEGVLDRTSLLALLAEKLECEFLPNVPQSVAREGAMELPAPLARTRGVIPWRVSKERIDLLARDPFDAEALDDLTFALEREVRFVVADPEHVAGLIDRHYGEESGDGAKPAADPTSAREAGADRELSANDLETLAAQPPVVRFVNRVLAQAIRDQASDIHFEPFRGTFKIRSRIDGVLYEVESPPLALALPITSRLKVLANLNIAERRLPQDGRITVTMAGRAVDLRVSTLPTQFGESVVLRVLDQRSVQLDLEQLGLPSEVLEGVRETVRRPNGLFIVTGPTGSGKTTTLYGGLKAINTVDRKLLTAEDPVEYEIEGIMQVSVNSPGGVTFASALRSFLRQDPDVIMVGEIRDLETARVAIQASLTGHLVLSTLHTNDAAGAITRLVDLGVEPFLIASTLASVLAQRLVRRICPECREAVQPSQEVLAQLGLEPAIVGDRPFFFGRGCACCDQTGYRGRFGLFEWLPVTDAIRDLIVSRAPLIEIRARATAQGMRALRADGLRAIFEGETTVEEVLRCT